MTKTWEMGRGGSAPPHPPPSTGSPPSATDFIGRPAGGHMGKCGNVAVCIPLWDSARQVHVEPLRRLGTKRIQTAKQAKGLDTDLVGFLPEAPFPMIG